jgi:hypothetical protein
LGAGLSMNLPISKNFSLFILTFFFQIQEPFSGLVYENKNIDFYRYVIKIQISNFIFICISYFFVTMDQKMWNINRYKIKTMYFYSIAIQIYVFVCTNISLFIYFKCIIIMTQSPWIVHIHKLCQNLLRLHFQFSTQVYSMKLFIHTTSCSYQMKILSKISNTHLYINQKKIKQEIFWRTHHMISNCHFPPFSQL